MVENRSYSYNQYPRRKRNNFKDKCETIFYNTALLCVSALMISGTIHFIMIMFK